MHQKIGGKSWTYMHKLGQGNKLPKGNNSSSKLIIKGLDPSFLKEFTRIDGIKAYINP